MAMKAMHTEYLVKLFVILGHTQGLFLYVNRHTHEYIDKDNGAVDSIQNRWLGRM